MDVVYLDNAATTFPKPSEVYDYMMDMYKNYGINVGRGKSCSAINIDTIINDTRKMLKDLVNAKDSYEAVFAPSATIALNQILFGLDYSSIKNVYISKFEHNAVLRTLNELKKRVDINIHFLEFENNEWDYNYDKIKYQFSNEKPDLIIINHTSNVFGYTSDIEKLYEISKEYNPKYVIDASQSLGVESIDVSRCKFDFIVFAGHKTLYAPFGIAGFIMNKSIDLKPLIYGGTGTESANLDMPSVNPTKYEAGSMNILSVFGLYKALLWINEVGIASIKERKKQLTDKLVSVIEKYDYIQSYIPKKNHTSIVSFRVKGYPVDSIGEALANNYNIALRYGLHCAPHAHEVSNTLPEGTIRVSIGYFTTEEDIEKFDYALSELEYEI